MSSDGPDRSYESSPDPLNASINESILQSRRKVTRSAKTPLTSSSSSKQNRRASIPESTMEFSSPSKSMIMSTGSQAGASPWRIKVTVEAQPGSGSDAENNENMQSPTFQRRTRTTTTTVPLKDADSSSPVKRRGRPRKSDTTAGAKAKRGGTPVGKRAQSRRRKSSIGVSDPSAADESTDTAPKKRKSRAKKSAPPEIEDEETPISEGAEQYRDTSIEKIATNPELEPDASTVDVEKTVAVPQQPTPQPSAPNIQTTFATPQDTPLPKPLLQGKFLMPPVEVTKSHRRPPIPEYEEDINFTPPNTELSKRIRARKGTPHSKVVTLLDDLSDEDTSDENGAHTPSGTDEDAPVIAAHEQDSFAQGAVPEDVAQGQCQKGDNNDDIHEATTYAFEEGVTRMPDDTTILDSENFSMVSVDSLPSSGGLTSPLDGRNINTSHVHNEESHLDGSYLKIPTPSIRRSPRQATKSSPGPLRTSIAQPQTKSSLSAPRRHKTPVMETRSPSNPPAIEPLSNSHLEAETPKIGRVVRAGVALQGVVDPSRITPTTQSPEHEDEHRDSLDDLFRGFSAGTRKELQAGLRLGEQLARENVERQPKFQSSPKLSSPIKPSLSRTQTDDVFSPRSKHRKSRLLTPEDQDEYSLPPPPASNTKVRYPSLRVNESDAQLVSPARSEDEMSWRVDTPPVIAESSRVPQIANASGKQAETYDAQGFMVPDDDEKDKEDYSDIWQEEASRSSDLPVMKEVGKTPQLQDLFANGGLIKPPRRKLPRTWRRKSSSDFNYSDEAEEPVQEASATSSEEAEGLNSTNLEKGKSRLMTPPSEEESYEPAPSTTDKEKRRQSGFSLLEEYDIEDEDDLSEASDDTGMFFQSNLPSIFNKKRSAELRKRKNEKLDLSLLIDEGQSLIPESSPAAPARQPANIASSPLPQQSPAPVREASINHKLSPSKSASESVKQTGETLNHSLILDDGHSLAPESSPLPIARTPVNNRPNPFKNTPPRFVPHINSPAKGSPLRQELSISESEEGREEATGADESILPPSSPFHTIVDITAVSVASDEQQFCVEMEGKTDSSIRNLREEADARAEAYESHYRTLHDIDEVTEPSRSMRSTFMLPSSPPSVLEDSVLRPKRAYSPLFGGEQAAASAKQQTSRSVHKTREVPRIAIAPPTDDAPPPASTGIFGRLTSTLWSALGTSTPPPPHPVTAKFSSLPKIEPWTKTHYKTLDALYQLQKKQPTLFAPSHSSSTSNTNNALLSHFLSTYKGKFVGAKYSVWGYSVVITEELAVLAAVYMQLLKLKDVAEYEKVNGKKIKIGDCNPGPAGTAIDGAEVMRRLATVVMGEQLRRDEKKGKTISREGTLTVEWPN